MNIADVDRNVGNFYQQPHWNTTMSAKEVEYMFDKYSDLVFCNGRVRKITVDKITDNCFKVYTKRSI